jgi:HlyD family secretion protein
MKRNVRRLLLALPVVGLIIAGVAYMTRSNPVAVSLATVDTGRVESTVANTRAGTVTACHRARLAPPTGGQVARLNVAKGAHVESGQVLLELWNVDLRAQLKLTQSQVQSSRALADEACVVARQAQREADRQVKLKRKHLASDEDVDRAVANAEAKDAACRAARAGVDVSAAQVDVARAALDRTILKAPFAGTVAEINGEVGEFATPSPIGIQTPPAIDLIDNSCLYVSAPIDEYDAPAIRLDMPVRISLDAFPGKAFPGTVRRIAPYVLEVEKQARTVEVEADFNDPAVLNNLLTGYSADIEIILDAHDKVTRIPTEALMEGARVLVYHGRDGRLEERSVKTGLSNWKFTEVTAGLKPGEQVVVSVGREGVTAGARVVPERPPP